MNLNSIKNRFFCGTQIFKFLLVIIILMVSINNKTAVYADTHSEDMRAVWISTVYNSDYPSVKGNAESQKQEFIDKLTLLQSRGINTVVVQVRPKADALYPSTINPWSDVLTGKQGVNPGYDPLAFMIEETHKRNMSFHAWLNPYRVTTSGTDTSVLAENHPARLHPDWLITYNNALYYNPALADVKGHIRDTVNEILQNYAVDGIHFDDYFYPSDYPLPEGEDKNGTVANERRQHVNEMIKMVGDTVKMSGKNVLFGVSPMGIWKNIGSDATGSNTNGKESYYSVFADAREWIKNGTVDYIVPQIYWEKGHKLADYGTLVNWWANEVEGTNVKLYIGQALYKDVVAGEIDQQLLLNQSVKNVKGSFFFSYKDIEANRQGCADKIAAFYKKGGEAVQPPIVPTEPENKPETVPPVIEKPVVTQPTKKAAALPTTSKVIVDGKEVSFEAYNIEGSNYFKLRDVAMVLSGSQKQFDVLWDDVAKAININLGSAYMPSGGELTKGSTEKKQAVSSNDKLLLNGNEILAEAYNIDGNNYFKLRDLGKAIDFAITWNEQENTVGIVTFSAYEEEASIQ